MIADPAPAGGEEVKRSMSITPTCRSAAAHRSDCWFTTAPTSSPPFEWLWSTSCVGVVMP